MEQTGRERSLKKKKEEKKESLAAKEYYYDITMILLEGFYYPYVRSCYLGS